MDGIACPIANVDDETTISGHELWLPCSNSRIDILHGSLKGWQQYHRILCPQIGTPVKSANGSGYHSQPTTPHQVKQIKLTTACIVEKAVWIGDAEGNIYAFNASDCGHLFSYALEPAQPCPVVALVYLKKFSRVAAGLENGRMFLLDSTLTPSTSVSAEGSFVLSELGSGERLKAVRARLEVDHQC